MLINNSDLVDKLTLHQIGLRSEHHEIHSGKHFKISNFLDLDNGSSINIGLQTPDINTHLHLIYNALSQAEIEIEFFEGSTITFDGTDLTPINNNRNSLNTSILTTLQIGPTIINPGTVINRLSLGSVQNPVSGTSLLYNRSRETVLKQNTNYLLKITSRLNDNTVNYFLDWYEQEVKIEE
jgi:hypothetical protein